MTTIRHCYKLVSHEYLNVSQSRCLLLAGPYSMLDGPSIVIAIPRRTVADDGMETMLRGVRTCARSFNLEDW